MNTNRINALKGVSVLYKTLTDYYYNRFDDINDYDKFDIYQAYVNGDNMPLKNAMIEIRGDKWDYLHDNPIYERIEDFYNGKASKFFLDTMERELLVLCRIASMKIISRYNSHVIKDDIEETKNLFTMFAFGSGSVEVVEGCLLDNLFYEMEADFPYPYMGLIEHYLTPNSSGYEVHFFETYDEALEYYLHLKKSSVEAHYNIDETVNKMSDTFEYGIKSGQINCDINDPDDVLECVDDFIDNLYERYDGNNYEESMYYYADYLLDDFKEKEDVKYIIACNVITDMRGIYNPIKPEKWHK